jgi:ankyrin repeat protein
MLLTAGAKVDAKDGLGNTALMPAVYGEDVESMAALLAAGADPNAKREDGRSVMDFCSESSECWRVLESAREAWALDNVVAKAGPCARKASL